MVFRASWTTAASTTVIHVSYGASGSGLPIDLLEDLREWSLFAIRNVCKDFPDAQRFIAAMEPQRMSANPELANAGCEAFIDERGRLKLRPKQ